MHMSGRARGRQVVWCLVSIVVLLAGALVGCGQAPEPTRDRPGPAAVSRSAAVTPSSGLRVVRVSALPPQARKTLDLIDRGGPFPYRQDGQVFGNRERLLPDRARGYYREYTVPTPGERDRGARRIVAGGRGDVYYTDDHYETFRQVAR